MEYNRYKLENSNQRSIAQIKIKNLFGRFDYDILLNGSKQKMCILSAPNGFGKSTILEMIDNFAKGNLNYFYEKEFDEVFFRFTNNQFCKIYKGIKKENNNIKTLDVRMISELSSSLKDNVIIIFEYKNNKIEYKHKDIFRLLRVIERKNPYLTRLSEDFWRDERDGEIIHNRDLLQRYNGDTKKYSGDSDLEYWFKDLILSLNVLSISTSRLKSELSEMSRRRTNNVVEQIEENIQRKIRESIQEQFEKGRELETSFPNRILHALNKDNNYSYRNSVKTVISLLEQIQEKENKYSQLGIIPNSNTTKQIYTHLKQSLQNEGGAELKILEIYLKDILDKFSLVDDLANRLNLFRTSVNDLLSFKQIDISANKGIEVKDIETKISIPLARLSSGEQHLIVLLGLLIFDTKENSLVLIDEPEISFHPEWQHVFIKVISKIQKINKLKFMIATHSYIIINDDNWDNLIDLSEQYKYRRHN